MRIAAHHKPGHWLATDTDYVPTCAWPEDCGVQWGSSGVVFGGGQLSYTTAFFEAFPNDNASDFIRGEGASIANAEANAFASYSREVACEHRFGRRGYLNGLGRCVHCGAGKSVFQPVHELGWWRKPVSRWDASFLDLDEERLSPDGRKLFRIMSIRKRLFGIEPPRTSEAAP